MENWWFYGGLLWSNGIYPLVICYIAILKPWYRTKVRWEIPNFLDGGSFHSHMQPMVLEYWPLFTNIYHWPSHVAQYSIVFHTWSIWDTKMGVPIFARWMVDFMENIRTNMDDLKVPLADLENLHNISIWWFLTMGNPQVTISFKTNMVYNELNYFGVPPL